MSTTATQAPPVVAPQVTSWHSAQPWVIAGVAVLGEMLVARGLCEANPASNGGAAYVDEQFTLEPGRFATADLEVRWGRHVGTGGVQSRPCSRAEWAALLGCIRISLQGVRSAA